MGLNNSFKKKRLGFARAGGTTEEAILRRAFVKLFLAIKRLVMIAEKHYR